jgi:two-component system, NarL family, nitrate/nitrite response regulator NarL
MLCQTRLFSNAWAKRGKPVSAQSVETLVGIEDLLRLILDQVEDEMKPAHLFDKNDLTTTVLLEVLLDGAQYRLTRQATAEALPESSCITLSPREQEVARLVAKGLSNKAIAAVLDISPWTVSTHLRRIFAKLDVGSRAEMITKALQEGLSI